MEKPLLKKNELIAAKSMRLWTNKIARSFWRRSGAANKSCL